MPTRAQSSKVPEQTLMQSCMTVRPKNKNDEELILSMQKGLEGWKLVFEQWLDQAEKVLRQLPEAIRLERRRRHRRSVQIHICAIDSSDFADPEAFLESERAPNPNHMEGVAAILYHTLQNAGLNPQIVWVNKSAERMYDLVITTR